MYPDSYTEYSQLEPLAVSRNLSQFNTDMVFYFEPYAPLYDELTGQFLFGAAAFNRRIKLAGGVHQLLAHLYKIAYEQGYHSAYRQVQFIPATVSFENGYCLYTYYDLFSGRWYYQQFYFSNQYINCRPSYSQTAYPIGYFQ